MTEADEKAKQFNEAFQTVLHDETYMGDDVKIWYMFTPAARGSSGVLNISFNSEKPGDGYTQVGELTFFTEMDEWINTKSKRITTCNIYFGTANYPTNNGLYLLGSYGTDFEAVPNAAMVALNKLVEDKAFTIPDPDCNIEEKAAIQTQIDAANTKIG